jgi:hypothetical protein
MKGDLHKPGLKADLHKQGIVADLHNIPTFRRKVSNLHEGESNLRQFCSYLLKCCV